MALSVEFIYITARVQYTFAFPQLKKEFKFFHNAKLLFRSLRQ